MPGRDLFSGLLVLSAGITARNRRLCAALMLGAALAGCERSTPPELGAEQVPPTEAADIARVIALFKAQVAARDADGPTRRGAHPKHHGCVQAQFTVLPNLPPAHYAGLFQPGASYPALVRFSNNADPQPDQAADVRGMAIKLFNVPGPRLFQPDAAASTHDLLLVSHPVFLFPDVATYTKAFAAFGEDRALSFFFNPLDPHLRAFLIVRAMLASHTDLLAVRWFSMVPYRFGARQAVKYSARPCETRTSRPAPAAGQDPDFLRTRLRAALTSNSACFEFAVQFQRDPAAMPIEDPSVNWSEEHSPFIPLARLHIPPQDFTTPAQMAQCENLAFNPWRVLPAHRPLGGISRARRVIYEAMAAFRHERNQTLPAEPVAPAGVALGNL